MRRPVWLSSAAVLALWLPTPGEPLSAGKWLVDLGRDYPLSPQAGLSDADAEITLLFMQAAARVQPELAEAYLWQYDMLGALGRDLEARASLGQYMRLEPGDVAACLNWLALTIESLQTAQERADACRSYLERGHLPQEASSDLHHRLADFHFNRGEIARAIDEAEAALRDYEFNLAAHGLRDELRDMSKATTRPAGAAAGQPSPVRRIQMLLATLALSPGDAEAAWQLASELRLIGLAPQADRWYQHAVAVYQLLSPDHPPPALEADPDAGGPATQPVPAEIPPMLDAFPRAVLDYPFHPEMYLALSVRMGSAELPPGEPWRCTIRIENKGSFPITLGRGMMVVPDLLCAIEARGDQARTSGPTIHISLNRKLRLMPGESIELAQTLDVGPIRSAMIGTPQRAHMVEVSAVLSPIVLTSADGQETWAPDIGGLLAEPVKFHRSAFTARPAAMDALLARSRTGDPTARIAATELLAMLLAEHQHLTAGRLHYRARRIDADAVRAAVLARVDDPDWHVCARLAESMRWFVLDQDAKQAAAKLLRDPHWLVRGLTLRMLADQYAGRVGNVLERYAKDDGDAWVRRLAGALVARMTPSTQPADSG